jgi:DNA recombination protein Rad52
MAFSEAQTQLLAGKLNRRHVRTRESRGQVLSYVEGWHVIAEANRVFGFEGWDRETVWCECVWEDGRRDPKACAYAARVRIRVRAGDGIVCREGSGVGHGTGATLGEAHENALKEAETDAMKRALTTFGNLFGLALYDKEQAGVRGAPKTRETPALAWTVLSPDGHAIATCIEPKAFCTRLRQALSAAPDAIYLKALWNQNAGLVQALETHRPDLVTRKGVHFASVLVNVFEEQLAKLTAQSRDEPAPGEADKLPGLVVQNGAEPAPAGAVDKSVLAISAPKRIRDSEHLEYVASLPCLVCGRTPSQAHHLRFAQPRALGSKVSDEWAVPLCNLHHRALHDCGAEETWWRAHNVDAVAEAVRLWSKRRHSGSLTAPPQTTQNHSESPLLLASSQETILAQSPGGTPAD